MLYIVGYLYSLTLKYASKYPYPIKDYHDIIYMHKQIPSLNGLRAISIIFVIINHLSYKKNIFHNSTNPFINFVADGQMGVNIFFVISGFLITTLLLQEEKASGEISLRNFYVRRTLRIFPAYYLIIIVYGILNLLSVISISSFSFFTSIFYVKDFFVAKDWYTIHFWSLSVEEQFYLAWPLIFSLKGKARKIIPFILFFSVPVFRLISHYKSISWLGEFSFFLRMDAIAIGCIMALYKDRIVNILRPFFVAAFVCSILGLFLLSQLVAIGLKFNLHLGFFILPFGQTFGTFANIFIAVIILYSIYGTTGFWCKFLNTKIITFVGTISYSLYLWQQLIVDLNLPVYLIIALIFIAAVLSYYVIEKPLLKLKNRLQFKEEKNPSAVTVRA